MKALMKTRRGVGNFEVRDVARPGIKAPDEVLIRVRAAGVCGTDVHIYHDTFKNFPPVILGHEFSGYIEETGDAVTGFQKGDLVVCEPHTLFCGKCEMCRAGMIQLCEHKRSPGWGIDGAFTDYVVVPSLFLHHVPEGVDPEVAALAEPMAIVTHEVLERSRVEPMDTLAVVGAGPIGLLACTAAKAGGAKRVYLIGKGHDSALRFPAALRLGADAVIDGEVCDPAQRIMELTNGRGADMAVEATGAQSGINTAIDVIRKCGRVCVIGIPKDDELQIKWKTLVNKVATVYFNMSSSVSSWERSLAIMATTPYDLTAAITHRASIEDWEAVFDDIRHGKAIKALFIPDEYRTGKE
ncbi:MAG: alcohol dehydrogenase catalytic domain-containing protein [Oscillospiraceae bacterium]|nr:alcohol dehydrogenase catalytic domain-containing protein [Oscillospiraceae bacterium]